MFSVTVAWFAFVSTTFVLLVLAQDYLSKTQARRDFEKLCANINGKRSAYRTDRILGTLLVWFLSGWYLFG